MKCIASFIFALLLSATGSQAGSLVGKWNCQASNGDAAIGRIVSYAPDGRFTSRTTLRLRTRFKGQPGSMEITASSDGRYATKGNALSERVSLNYAPAISFTYQGKKNVIRGRDAKKFRKKFSDLESERFWIRALGESNMTLQHAGHSYGYRASGMNISCRRIR